MVDALNPEQEAAACHRGSHLLLVAGAGTRQDTYPGGAHGSAGGRGHPSRSALGHHFYQQSRRWIERALVAALGAIGTQWNVPRDCFAMAKTHGQWRNRSLYDDRDQLQLITGLLKSLPGGATPQAVKSALQQVRLHPHLPRPDWDRAGQIAQEILPRYLDRLERLHAIDFQGLLEEACAVVESGQLDGLYAEVLVDEFQDTDPFNIES